MQENVNQLKNLIGIDKPSRKKKHGSPEKTGKWTSINKRTSPNSSQMNKILSPSIAKRFLRNTPESGRDFTMKVNIFS